MWKTSGSSPKRPLATESLRNDVGQHRAMQDVVHATAVRNEIALRRGAISGTCCDQFTASRHLGKHTL